MNQKFLTRSLELAAEGMREGKGGPFGAVVVRGDDVIGEAYNTVTSSHDPTAHAEVSAIRKACAALGNWSLAGCDIYASCEPCPMCLGAIHWARLERLYYAASRDDAAAIGFDDARLYAELAKPPSARRLVAVQSGREEAWQIMRGFSALPASRRY